MYTGTQKRAVVLKTKENSIFEEAYFILKDDRTSVKESDMIREANKILKNNIVGGYFFENTEKEQPKKQTGGLFYFLLGAFFSFVLCTLLFLFIK